jgi:hypothetical protein
MPPHLLVAQLRFTRSEFLRCLEGVSEQDALRRLEPMNCLSWIVGHLTTQENAYWVLWAQGQKLAPDLYKLVGHGQPASTPPWDEMWDTWREITSAADEYLDTLTEAQLHTHLEREGKPLHENIGTMLYRNIHHYWFHLGEAHAIRQMLGHTDLPDFVGDMSQALYR